MILRHRDSALLRFAWISSDEVRVDFVDEGLRHLLPLAFDPAAKDSPAALERALAAWLLRRTTPIFDNGYGLFSLLTLPENCAIDDFAPIQAYLRGKHPALFDHWLGFPNVASMRLGDHVARLRGFRFRRHHHYNLPADRITLIERFLQKRVDDILQYLENADECLQVPNARVGVNSKAKSATVGDGELQSDPLALQILWNLKANPLMTMGELAMVLGREKRTIERKVRKLREEGHLRRVGSDKSGSWMVIV